MGRTEKKKAKKKASVHLPLSFRRNPLGKTSLYQCGGFYILELRCGSNRGPLELEYVRSSIT